MNNLKINSALLVQKQYKKITFAAKYTKYSSAFRETVMMFIKKYFLVIQCIILIFGMSGTVRLYAQEARFTVVLDAGHGGHDSGAVGSISKEKDLNLLVVLALGEIIEKNYKDVKIVYTRKTDKYLTLQERADVVNNNHADLFICIHTNAAKSSSAYGAETYTLGLAKSKSNLDVAMRENSVILLEEDYKTKYKGFDPNSIDSYIMFEFMQDKYIDKSVEFSSIIQKQFVNYCRRSDRGVRQAGFWVLHRSACPSVLIELGFISNPAEERYLSSSQGQKEMAGAIFNAFVNFKKEYEKKSGVQTKNISKVEQIAQPAVIQEAETTITEIQKSVEPIKTLDSENDSKTKEKNELIEKSFQKPVFKIQLFATTKVLKTNSSEFKGLQNVEYYTEGGLNKYTTGNETNFKEINKVRQEILSKFPQAFIIAFSGEKKLSAKETKELSK